MTESTFGWELVFQSAHNELNSKTDVLVAFIHFVLLKNKFRNIGIGDDRTLTPNEADSASELLPDGWNQMGEVYKLRYVNDGKIFILNCVETEGLLIANLLSSENLELSNVAFKLEDTVNDVKAPFKTALKDVNGALNKIKLELVEPVYKGSQKGANTQTEAEHKRAYPRDFGEDLYRNPYSFSDDRRGFPPEAGVGSADLDPLGRLGPGNLFDPPGIGRLPGHRPGGSNPHHPSRFIPPGARFDPFGPPAGGRQRFDPDPDHERPPGYDDMFM